MTDEPALGQWQIYARLEVQHLYQQTLCLKHANLILQLPSEQDGCRMYLSHHVPTGSCRLEMKEFGNKAFSISVIYTTVIH